MGAAGRRVIDAYLAEQKAANSKWKYRIVIAIVIITWPMLFTSIKNARKPK